MSKNVEGDGSKRVRPGVCHRCGWSGPVSKVRRRDRKLFNIGRTYGRLCSECVEALVGREQAQSIAVSGSRAGHVPGRARHVA